MKILVVDDDPITLTALTDLLAMDGHDTDHAANGHGALGIISIFSPDVIIMDWRMPAGDGEQLLTAIRRDGQHKHVPVLILTALSASEMAEEITRLPVNPQPYRILFKPATLEQMKDELRDLARLTV